MIMSFLSPILFMCCTGVEPSCISGMKPTWSWCMIFCVVEFSLQVFYWEILHLCL
jgi:hypothetical protein